MMSVMRRRRKKKEVSITTLIMVWYIISIVHINILDFIVLVRVIHKKSIDIEKKKSIMT
jgi:cytoskeletal protein RodZ